MRYLIVFLFLAGACSAQVPQMSVAPDFQGFGLRVSNLPTTCTLAAIFVDDGESTSSAYLGSPQNCQAMGHASRIGLAQKNYKAVLLVSDGTNVTRYEWGQYRPRDVLEIVGASYPAAAQGAAARLAAKWGKPVGPILATMRRAIVRAWNTDRSARATVQQAAMERERQQETREKINLGDDD